MPTIDPTKRSWRIAPDWEERELSAAERAFLDAYAALEKKSVDKFGLPDVWLHEDDDGTPWMVLAIYTDKTWRLDFDAGGIRGGESPSHLNGDDGARAQHAGIDMQKPQGICMDGQDAIELATLARGWLIGRSRKWSRTSH